MIRDVLGNHTRTDNSWGVCLDLQRRPQRGGLIVMGRPYTEWDEKEIKQLEEMKKDGYTVKQISQKLGRGEANNHVHGTNIIKNLDGEVWCCEKNYKP